MNVKGLSDMRPLSVKQPFSSARAKKTETSEEGLAWINPANRG